MLEILSSHPKKKEQEEGSKVNEKLFHEKWVIFNGNDIGNDRSLITVLAFSLKITLSINVICFSLHYRWKKSWATTLIFAHNYSAEIAFPCLSESSKSENFLALCPRIPFGGGEGLTLPPNLLAAFIHFICSIHHIQSNWHFLLKENYVSPPPPPPPDPWYNMLETLLWQK